MGRRREARRELEVGQAILRLKATADAQPVGHLNGKARGRAVGTQRGTLAVERARPVGILERGFEPKRRVDGNAGPDAIGQPDRCVAGEHKCVLSAVGRSIGEAEEAHRTETPPQCRSVMPAGRATNRKLPMRTGRSASWSPGSRTSTTQSRRRRRPRRTRLDPRHSVRGFQSLQRAHSLLLSLPDRQARSCPGQNCGICPSSPPHV